MLWTSLLRDYTKGLSFLLETIDELKKENNTVIIVEHKKCFMSIADRHIEMGPKAGRYGGEIVIDEDVLENEKPAFLAETHYQIEETDYLTEDCIKILAQNQ